MNASGTGGYPAGSKPASEMRPPPRSVAHSDLRTVAHCCKCGGKSDGEESPMLWLDSHGCISPEARATALADRWESYGCDGGDYDHDRGCPACMARMLRATITTDEGAKRSDWDLWADGYDQGLADAAAAIADISPALPLTGCGVGVAGCGGCGGSGNIGVAPGCPDCDTA